MASYGSTSTTSNPVQRQPQSSGLLSELMGGPPAPARLKVPQKDLLVFFRQLAVILQSGVPLAQGLILIAENMTNENLSQCVQRISSRLSAGEELSLSLRQYPKVFEPLTIGLIEAGEAGGILEDVLDRIALLLEERAKIRGQIIGALVYPVIVMVLAVSVSLALLIFIVPRFKAMFDGMGAELPALTNFLLELSKFVTSPYFTFGAPLTVLLGMYLFRGYYSTAIGRLNVDKNILKVPLLVIFFANQRWPACATHWQH